MPHRAGGPPTCNIAVHVVGSRSGGGGGGDDDVTVTITTIIKQLKYHMESINAA
jgi:hypothetical protein